jgi:mono/diheme cytochrome c family protein
MSESAPGGLSFERCLLRQGDRLMCRLITALIPVIALASVTITSAQPKGNPEARKLKNPHPISDASITAGRGAYKRRCIFCHGPQAKGNAPTAPKDLKTKPSDLTDDKWTTGSTITDGELFSIIRNGVPPDFDMKPEKVLKDDEIWHTINFLRSLAPKK